MLRLRKLSSVLALTFLLVSFLSCGLSVWKTRITGSDPVGNSSRSERTRAIKTPCAYLIFSHTGGEDDGTGSTTRRYVL